MNSTTESPSTGVTPPPAIDTGASNVRKSKPRACTGNFARLRAGVPSASAACKGLCRQMLRVRPQKHPIFAQLCRVVRLQTLRVGSQPGLSEAIITKIEDELRLM